MLPSEKRLTATIIHVVSINSGESQITTLAPMIRNQSVARSAHVSRGASCNAAGRKLRITRMHSIMSATAAGSVEDARFAWTGQDDFTSLDDRVNADPLPL